MGDAKSLAHIKWNCKYHIVFAPKYRRQVFYGEKKRVIGEILRKLCEWMGVTILKAEAWPDHIHMLLEIPPKFSVSSIMGYLKGKSSLMIYGQFGDLNIATGNFGADSIMWILSKKTRKRFNSITVINWKKINLETN